MKFLVIFSVVVASAFGFVLENNANNLNSRIVGGDYAVDGQFPYQISLREFGNHVCGGSIINSRWILTASHCFNGFNVSGLSILIGTTTLDHGGIEYTASRVIRHEDYDVTRFINDICVIELSTEIEFSDNVQPIELDTEEVVDVDLEFVFSGWGWTDASGTRTNDLKFMSLKSISQSDCRVLWTDSEIVDHQLCTMPAVEGEGVCRTDSGGPLVRNGKQVGLFTLGSACANGLPEVFTRVSAMMDWIQYNINS